MAALLSESTHVFDQVPRAQRFPGQLRVLCRREGQSEWVEGTAFNASRSGILFRTDESLPEGTAIEMLVVFSSSTSDRLPRGARCRGRIVRTERTAQAAAVEFCGFVFSSQLTPTGVSPLQSRPRRVELANDGGPRPFGA